MQPSIFNQWDHVPPHMTTLGHLHSYAHQLAAHCIEKYGHCNTLWVIVREQDAQIVHTPWSDEAEKNFHIDWMRETFDLDESIERYAFLGEMYLFDQHDGETDTFHRKVDGLLVQTQQRDGSGFIRTYEVVETAAEKKSLLLLVDDNLDGLEAGAMTTLFQPSQSLRFGGH